MLLAEIKIPMHWYYVYIILIRFKYTLYKRFVYGRPKAVILLGGAVSNSENENIKFSILKTSEP